MFKIIRNVRKPLKLRGKIYVNTILGLGFTETDSKTILEFKQNSFQTKTYFLF